MKEDLSNRVDVINKKLDDQVNEMKNFEQKTVDLQNVIDECRGKLKIRDSPAPIDVVTKDEQDMSAILLAIDSIPQEDLSPRNQVARDVNNIKEQVKVIFFSDTFIFLLLSFPFANFSIHNFYLVSYFTGTIGNTTESFTG